MEALAAIGLASNILQFTGFASKLFSTTKELHNATTDATSKTQELENIYKTLEVFSERFVSSNDSYHGGQHSLQLLHTDIVIKSPQATALRELASGCKGVCDELIVVLQHTKVSDGRWRKFQCFKAAIRTMLDANRINDLETRIQRFQSAIETNFLPILSDQQCALSKAVNTLRSESQRLNLNQTESLSQIYDKLCSIVTMLKAQKKMLQNSAGIMDPTLHPAWNPERNLLHQEPQIQGALRPNMLSGIRHQRLDVESLSETMSIISMTQNEAQDVAREQRLIADLTFPSRPVRYQSIPAAHTQTFRWALEPVPVNAPTEVHNSKTRACLASWLSCGDGVFWVSGKPGSGKSTLMKFMVDQPRTMNLLDQWAHPKKAAIASHYFWSAGTSMQKSELGLLRALLYEILRICPELIPQVCHERWANSHNVQSSGVTSWNTQELKTIMQRVAVFPDLPMRLCFFIDGIDEFEGDHDDLCSALQALSQSQNFKLCLSSRPWNVFEDSFGHNEDKKLYIHDLTHKDIQKFTTSRLDEHALWNTTRFHQSFKTSVIDEITDRAQGVFLWVFLVTNSLRKGLSNGDTRRDLHARLRGLPTDLNKFFKHMLDLVDPIYEEEMSQTLCLAANAKEPLHFLIFDKIDSMSEPPSYSDENNDELIIYDDLEYLKDPEDRLEDQYRRRINARCGGLLDLNASGNVEFLHRTVRDFLFLRDMTDYLEAKRGADFKPNLCTLKAFAEVVKSNPKSFSLSFWGQRESIRQALRYANAALEEDPESAFQVLFGLGFWAQIHGGLEDTGLLDRIFRQEILKAGVSGFVDRMLQDSENYFEDLVQSPLALILKEDNLESHHFNILRTLITQDKSMKIHDEAYLMSRFKMVVYGVFTDHVIADEASTSLNDGDELLIDPFIVAHRRSLSGMSLQTFNRLESAARHIIAVLLDEDHPAFDIESTAQVVADIHLSTDSSIKFDCLQTFAAILRRVIDIGERIGVDLEAMLPVLLVPLPAATKMLCSGSPIRAARFQGSVTPTPPRKRLLVEKADFDSSPTKRHKTSS